MVEKTNNLLIELKHINNLRIGDEVLIEIPTLFTHIGKVSFINKELKFIFIDGKLDDEDGFQIIPDKNGFFKVKI